MDFQEFMKVKNCNRCGNPLGARTASWFTFEPICLDCAFNEDVLKEQIRTQGKNPLAYEGCGYIPKID